MENARDTGAQGQQRRNALVCRSVAFPGHRRESDDLDERHYQQPHARKHRGAGRRRSLRHHTTGSRGAVLARRCGSGSEPQPHDNQHLPGRANMARNLCPANYLESVLNVNNPAADGTYATGVPNAQYNDRLLYITAADIIPAVEMRVGTELKNLRSRIARARSAAASPGRTPGNTRAGSPTSD